jgi:hypothetical protein
MDSMNQQHQEKSLPVDVVMEKNEIQQATSHDNPDLSFQKSRSDSTAEDSTTDSHDDSDDLLDDVILHIRQANVSDPNQKNQCIVVVEDNHIPIALKTDNNHHSLPDIEEIKRSQNKVDENSKCKKFWNRRTSILMSCAMFVFIIILVIVINMTVRKGSSTTTTIQNNDDIQDSSNTTTPPKTNIPPPTLPSDMMSYNEEIFQNIVFLLSIRQRISLPIHFETMNSPQYLAAMYFAKEYDPSYISSVMDADAYSNNFMTFIQRYVIVVFYYALNGPHWIHKYSFLTSNISICDWNDQRNDTESMTLGIACKESNRVTDIVLRKFYHCFRSRSGITFGLLYPFILLLLVFGVLISFPF